MSDTGIASIEVREQDVVESVFKASGPGGQKVNKTSSAIRIIHRPTGVIVTASDSRSQWANRQQAWDRLNARLTVIDSERRSREASAERVGQFGGTRQWVWCAWRDSVTNPSGKSMSMKSALRGGLARLGG